MEPKPSYEVGGTWAQQARAAWAEKQAEQAAATAAGFKEWFGIEPDGCAGWTAWVDGVVLGYRRRRFEGKRLAAEGWVVLCPHCGVRLGRKLCRSLADIGEVLEQVDAHHCEKGGGG